MSKAGTVDENSQGEDVFSGPHHDGKSTVRKAYVRARFRHAVISSIVGKKITPNTDNERRKSIANLIKRSSTPRPSICAGVSSNHCCSLSFSSPTYTVSKNDKEVTLDVLLNRQRIVSRIGFSHVVDVACNNSHETPDVSFTGKVLQKKSCTESVVTYGTAASGIETIEAVNHQITTVADQNEESSHHIDKLDELLESHNYLDSPISAANNGPLKGSFDTGLGSSISGLDGPAFSSTSMLQRYNSSKSTETFGDDAVVLRPSALDLIMTVTVEYETRSGDARNDEDFITSSGSLVFLENEFSKQLNIPIVPHKESSFSDRYFYVILKEPSILAQLAEPSVAMVTIVSEGDAGEFIFQDPSYHVQYFSTDSASVTATVVRIHGSDGAVNVGYRTINGTAYSGSLEDVENGECDFQQIHDGVLEFAAGETCKKLEIIVNPNAEVGKTFIIVLVNATGAGVLGHRCATIVSLSPDPDNIVDQIAEMEGDDCEEKPLLEQWKQQFIDGMYLHNASEVTFSGILLHFVAFFWKVLFAFVPPRSLFGGWAAFFVSLLLLGLLSALVEQFAKLLGCVIGLHVSVTGITLVALGTSMPDTFASRKAAEQDNTADAAIGNITGSNSVNVFLGLGLPWLIKVIYLHANGKRMMVQDTNLFFAVTLFMSCGVLCLFLLILRRQVLGGELGGRTLWKYTSGFTVIFLWVLFVVLCSLQAYNLIEVGQL